jgi:GNAT superfamily N-acetyltransferase
MNIRDVSTDTALGFIAYDDDGTRLGCIHASDNTIRQLDVVPDRQREGIGTALLAAVVSRCEPGSELEVTARGDGERFYLRRGFQSTCRFRLRVP